MNPVCEEPYLNHWN